MIVPMDKVMIATVPGDRDRLLECLGKMEVLHLIAVDPQKAMASQEDTQKLGQYDKAIEIIETLPASKGFNNLDPDSAVAEILQLQHDNEILSEKLKTIERQIDQTKLWGDTDPDVLEKLKQSGVQVEFMRISSSDIFMLQADCIEPLDKVSSKKLLTAVINRDSDDPLPKSAQLIERPPQGRRKLLDNAGDIENRIRNNQQRLGTLAGMSDQLKAQQAELAQKIVFSIAVASGLQQEEIVVFQGWMPAEKSQQLSKQLSDHGLVAALTSSRALPEEEPPTLISYRRWARPIKGILDMLGTFPGYNEADVSPFIMLALPIFAALLIGDGGYGILFILLAIILNGYAGDKIGKEKISLLLITGLATTAWGMATANYLGFSPAALSETGVAGGVRKCLLTVAVFWNSDSEIMRQWFMKLSLILGCVHLTIAHLQQALRLSPSPKMFAQLGWCLVLWVMLLVIWVLFFDASFSTSFLAAIGGTGLMLVILFSHADQPLFKRIGLGLAGAILPLMATFSDTISYIRLMAVGLASYYIAAAFNSLAAALADSTTWLVAVWILIFGHALNIALCVIAIFAHGVRLNLLEFSSNAAVQWSGYRYSPFSTKIYY